MENYTPLTYIDEEPNQDGRFLRVIYRRDPDNPHLPDVDNGYITSIEMVNITTSTYVDYENLHNRPEDYVEILMGLLRGDYNE